MAARQEGRIFGLYRDFPSLRLGVDSLKALRFDNQDISVLFPEAAVSRTLAEQDREAEASGQDAAFIGGALGWLTYVRPERSGIIAGALVSLGMPAREADLYEENLRSGHLLLCIRSSSTARSESAVNALAATGAESVATARSASRPMNTVACRLDASLGEQQVTRVFTC